MNVDDLALQRLGDARSWRPPIGMVASPASDEPARAVTARVGICGDRPSLKRV
jgi:hypothetical protein